jgi:hypothetical protein
MNFFVSFFRKITQIPLLCWVALFLQAIALWLTFRTYNFGGLRGGIFTNALILILVWVLSFGAIVQVLIARFRKSFKFGLVASHIPGLAILAPITAQTLLIVLIFGLGVCRTTYTSPTGQRSITIERSCFMGCTYTIYANHFIFERQLDGGYNLPSGSFCDSKVDMEWNKAETEVTWRIKGNSGLIKLR